MGGRDWRCGGFETVGLTIWSDGKHCTAEIGMIHDYEMLYMSVQNKLYHLSNPGTSTSL